MITQAPKAGPEWERGRNNDPGTVRHDARPLDSVTVPSLQPRNDDGAGTRQDCTRVKQAPSLAPLRRR